MTRAYVAHRWIATSTGGECIVCGIKESTWKRRIAKAPMIEHDCVEVVRKSMERKP